MAETGLVQIIEGALLAAGKPLTVTQLANLFEEFERPENTAIREALETVTERCEDRGFELKEVASGFRFQVRQSLSPWIGRLWQERAPKYSRALLETLALIAYRQPITRGEIEEIRGVAVSTNIVKTLHEREWIRVVGHRDVPGRPAMYATTRQFLDYFSLKSLDQLPALAEIRDLETLNAELGFGELGVEAGPGDSPALTVVGGTEHSPETLHEEEVQGEVPVEGQVEGQAEGETEPEPVSLSEAADVLESLAVETFVAEDEDQLDDGQGEVSHEELSNGELSDIEDGESITPDSSLPADGDDYVAPESSKPESQA